MVRMTAAKRRFCSHKAELQKLRACNDLWGSLPQSVLTHRQLPHQREPKNEHVEPCLPLMRKVAARLVAMTEGENYVSFEILNQWISKRESVASQNRIETQNPRPLNLWGRGFVYSNTAVIGCRHCRLSTCRPCRLRGLRAPVRARGYR